MGGGIFDEELISIITPTYNATRFIAETIDSVRKQSHEHWEMVICDDCSSDGTVELIEKIAAEEPRIRVIPLEENSGAAVARNTAMENAKGRYLAFVDADDVWVPEKLERQLEFMKQSDIAFCYTAYDITAEDGTPSGQIVDAKAKSEVDYTDMLMKRSTLGCSTVMLDRNQVGDVRMPLLRTGQDYGLWLSILKRGINAHVFREPLTKYRIVAGSISRNKIKKAKRQWQIYREVEKVPLLPAIYYFCNYGYRAVFRK